MSEFLRDRRFGLRLLAKSPVFNGAHAVAAVWQPGKLQILQRHREGADHAGACVADDNA